MSKGRARSIRSLAPVGSAALGVVALTLLFGGRDPTSFVFLGFSGSAWFTIIPLGMAIVTISGAFAARRAKELLIIAKPFALPLSSLSALVVLTSIQLVWMPRSEGLQSLFSLIGFLTIFSAVAFAAPIAPPRIWKLVILATGLTWTFILVMSSYVIPLGTLTVISRDHGETLVIFASVLPLLTDKKKILVPSLVFLLVATVLSDSRFSSAIQVIVGAVIVGVITHHYRRIARVWLVTFWMLGSAGLVVFLQQSFSLRSSLPPVPLLSTSQLPEPAAESIQLRNWSFGRSEVWASLFQEIKSPTEILIGKGPGFAADYGRTLNAAFHHPHNEYLRLFVDSGIVGLSMLTLFLASLLAAVWRQRFKLERSGLVTAVSLILVLAAQSLISNPLLTPHHFVPWALGLGVAINTGPNKDGLSVHPNLVRHG
jgi:hypothetical protein